MVERKSARGTGFGTNRIGKTGDERKNSRGNTAWTHAHRSCLEMPMHQGREKKG